MITSFFAPKAKAAKRGDSSTKKRQRNDEQVAVDPVNASGTKKQRAGEAAAASSTPLTEETATLLSFLHRHGAVDGEGTTSWRTAIETYFTTATFTALAKFVAKERASKTVYPPPDLTFSALNLTPLHKVKVVIVGQDPYHQPNQGHGLSFSVPRGIKIPPSLRNIYKELLSDDQVAQFTSVPCHGNLERWAKQGVLLLNNVLTVRRGEAASHAKRGWEQFTDRVIEAVIERDGAASDDREEGDEARRGDDGNGGTGAVFLLWGKPASLKAHTVLKKYAGGGRAARHAVIACSHPSPLGATKTKSPFTGSRCFSRANEELQKRGWPPVDWRVDGPLKKG